MSLHEGARVVAKEAAAIVSDGLSYYRLPDESVVGVTIIAYLLDAVNPVENVKLTRKDTVTTGTVISQVYGAPPDGKGIRSGTSGGPCRFLEHDGERGGVHVKVKGEEVVSHGDRYCMEVAPTGVANCEGLLCYVVSVGNGVLVDADTREVVPVGVVQDRASGEVAAPSVLENPIGSLAINVPSFIGAAFDGVVVEPATATAQAAWDGLADDAQFFHDSAAIWWGDQDAAQRLGQRYAGWAETAIGGYEAITHPGETLRGAWNSGVQSAAGAFFSLHDTAQRNPGEAAGEVWAGMFNAWMMFETGRGFYQAARDARAAAALAQAEREAQALALTEREAQALARAQEAPVLTSAQEAQANALAAAQRRQAEALEKVRQAKMALAEKGGQPQQQPQQQPQSNAGGKGVKVTSTGAAPPPFIGKASPGVEFVSIDDIDVSALVNSATGEGSVGNSGMARQDLMQRMSGGWDLEHPLHGQYDPLTGKWKLSDGYNRYSAWKDLGGTMVPITSGGDAIIDAFDLSFLDPEILARLKK